MENPSKHLSRRYIDLVKEKYPDIGLATIYRTLQLFDDLNIIKSLTLMMDVTDMNLVKINDINTTI